MIELFIALPLVVLASVGPEISQFDGERFRVQILFDDLSPGGHLKAQTSLTKSAEKFCRGKGKAVSEGTLTLNNAEAIRKGTKALELSEIYTCVPKKQS